MSARNRSVCVALATLSAVLFTAPALADDYGRPGWFVGVGGGLAVDFLDSAVDKNTSGLVELGNTGTFNVRGGYRVLSWLAFEAMYEGAYGYSVKVAGTEFANTTTHSLVVNMKLIAPIWRLHPYFILGGGAQQAHFDVVPEFAEALDTARWDPVIRVGVGLDAYVTDNWVVNLELTPSVRFADYSDLFSKTTDNVSLTFTGGVQYRF